MNVEDYKYKIELHAHTRPGSGCSTVSPEMMVEVHKQLGCDAVVITNHFEPSYFYKRFSSKQELVDKYLEGYYQTYELGKKAGLTVILGMEIRFEENNNNYLVFGVDEDFVAKASEYLDGTLERFYKEMKNDRNVIIHAHPFRPGMTIMPKEYLDGVETFNLHPQHNSRVGEAARYAYENNFEITTCGSDFHDVPQHGLALTRTKTLPKDSFELAELIKSHDYLFDFSGSIVIPLGFKENV